MSYDLFLASPQLDRAAFDRYFSGRRHYEDPGQYENKDTGVYFIFEFVEPSAGEGTEDDAAPMLRAPHVAFNINLFRPHVFGLEAEGEVTAFVEAFGCTMDDPQAEEAENGTYTPAGFLQRWNTSNQRGCRALVAQESDYGVVVADDALIERVWRWNLRRAAMQEGMAEGHFLPRANWAAPLDGGSPIVFAVWGSGVWIAVPECVTHVLLSRQPSKRLASLLRSSAPAVEVHLVTVDEIASLPGCSWMDGPNGRMLLAPVEGSFTPAVRKIFKQPFRGMDAVAKPMPADKILGASLLPPEKPSA